MGPHSVFMVQDVLGCGRCVVNAIGERAEGRSMTSSSGYLVMCSVCSGDTCLLHVQPH